MLDFFDKYIGHMYGPYFLIFYALFIGTLYVVCKYIFHYLDKSDNSDGPLIPNEPDPYIIAFIRNGPKEVIKVVLFSLLERKYLKVNSAKTKLKQHSKHPPKENLTLIESAVFNFVNAKPEIAELIEYKVYQGHVENLCLQNEFLVKNRDTVRSMNDLYKFFFYKIVCASLIFALGVYKLYMALSSGHSNVFFLIVLGIAGIVIIFNIKLDILTTKKGKLLLRDLETIYHGKYQQGANFVSPYYQMLLASIFGFHFLYGRGYTYLEKYKPTSYTNYGGGSSCSSSCGSSCGGGCGGGCGGCS